jgi:hypothetical protein
LVGDDRQFGYLADKGAGWLQPLKGQEQGRVPVVEAGAYQAKVVALGDEKVRAEHLATNEAFANDLGLVNAGFDETNTYQQIELYRRFLASGRPDGVLLVVSADDFLSRAEAAVARKEPFIMLAPPAKGIEDPLAAYRERLRVGFSWEELGAAGVLSDWTDAVGDFAKGLDGQLAIVFMPGGSLVAGKDEKGRTVPAGLAAWTKARGIPFLDLTPALASEPEASFDAVWERRGPLLSTLRHRLTPVGQKLVAAHIRAAWGGSGFRPWTVKVDAAGAAKGAVGH